MGYERGPGELDQSKKQAGEQYQGAFAPFCASNPSRNCHVRSASQRHVLQSYDRTKSSRILDSVKR